MYKRQDAKTLSQISTGKKENKFGVNEKTFLELVNYCQNSKNISLECLSVHIGSQILSENPFKKTLKVLEEIIEKTKHVLGVMLSPNELKLS